MYKLKNLDNEKKYKREITDIDYSALIFYKKWKYTKMNLLVTDEQYIQGPVKLMNDHYASLGKTKSVTADEIFKNKPYTKSYQSPTPKRNFDDNYPSTTDNTGNNILTGILINELLNQQPDIIDDMNQYDGTDTQAPVFEGFGGGDFSGGGSSGSWDENPAVQPDTTSQDSVDNSNDYQDNTPVDNDNFS